MATREQYGVSLELRNSETTRETFHTTEYTSGMQQSPSVVGRTGISDTGHQIDAGPNVVNSAELQNAYSSATTVLQQQLGN